MPRQYGHGPDSARGPVHTAHFLRWLPCQHGSGSVKGRRTSPSICRAPRQTGTAPRSPKPDAPNAPISRERAVKFRTLVEPPEPMRGLEVPPEVAAALGGGA